MVTNIHMDVINFLVSSRPMGNKTNSRDNPLASYTMEPGHLACRKVPTKQEVVLVLVEFLSVLSFLDPRCSTNDSCISLEQLVTRAVQCWLVLTTFGSCPQNLHYHHKRCMEQNKLDLDDHVQRSYIHSLYFLNFSCLFYYYGKFESFSYHCFIYHSFHRSLLKIYYYPYYGM